MEFPFLFLWPYSTSDGLEPSFRSLLKPSSSLVLAEADNPKRWLFRNIEGQSGTLTERPMSQTDVYRMIRRCADDAGIKPKFG